MKTTKIMSPFLLGAITLILTFSSVSYVSAQCVAPPSGLVSWWPGDGNTDEIVGARNGSSVGTAGFAPGMVADAFSFDGSGYIDVADDPIWTLGTEDFTIDLWVFLNSLSGLDPFISHDPAGGCNNKWIFWISTGVRAPFGPALRFHQVSPGNCPSGVDTVVFPWVPDLFRWYHVAVTRSGSDYSLYIDGELVITEQDSTPIADPSASLTIGRAESFFLNGRVDEVEIVDRALSAPEIQAIFDAGSSGKCKTVMILGAEVNLKNSTILISGINFGSTAPFSGIVKLFAPMQGEVELNVLAFDPVTQEILADLPMGIQDSPGTFRLTVNKQSNPPDLDHLDVAITGKVK